MNQLFILKLTPLGIVDRYSFDSHRGFKDEVEHILTHMPMFTSEYIVVSPKATLKAIKYIREYVDDMNDSLAVFETKRITGIEFVDDDLYNVHLCDLHGSTINSPARVGINGR